MIIKSKITYRIIIRISLLIILTMSISTGINIYTQIYSEKSNFINQSKIYTELIGNFSASKFLEDSIDYAELNATCELIVRNNDNLLYIEIYDITNYSDETVPPDKTIGYYRNKKNLNHTDKKELQQIIKKIKKDNYYISIKDNNIDIFSKYSILDADVLFTRLVYTSEYLNKKIFNLIYKSICITLLLIIIGIFIGVILSKKITEPINYLTDISKRIAEGNFDLKSDLKTDDEIEILSNSFNIMTEKLKSKIRDLEALHKLSTQLSSVLEKEQLLNLVLKSFIDALNIYKCCIFTFDPKTRKFILAAGKGLQPDYIKNYYLEENNEFDNYLASAKGTVLNLTEFEIKRLFYVPEKYQTVKNIPAIISALRVQDNVTGMIIVSEKVDGRDWTDDEMHMFEALVNQSAIAIENARLYELAITDELTKVYLYRYFRYQLDFEISAAIKYKQPLSIIMLDIDHFKKFNDTYGHQAGDKVLFEIAQTIKNSIRAFDYKDSQRSPDIVARYGGEEFVVILPKTSTIGAVIVAERIRKNVENKVVLYNDLELNVTISLGVTEWNNNYKDAKDFIEYADQALYFSKKNGRNKVSVYKDGDIV